MQLQLDMRPNTSVAFTVVSSYPTIAACPKGESGAVDATVSRTASSCSDSTCRLFVTISYHAGSPMGAASCWCQGRVLLSRDGDRDLERPESAESYWCDFNRCPLLIIYNSGVSTGLPTLKDVDDVGAASAHVCVVLARAMLLNHRVGHDYRIRDHGLSELRYVDTVLSVQIKLANPSILLQVFHPHNTPGDVCPECCRRRHHDLHDAQDTSPVIIDVSLSAFNVRDDMRRRS